MKLLSRKRCRGQMRLANFTGGRLTSLLLAAFFAASVPTSARATGGQLELKVVDQETGEPLPCRMHLKNQKGRAQKPPRFHSGTIILCSMAT